MEEHDGQKLGFYHLVMEIYWQILIRKATVSKLGFKKQAYEGCFVGQGKRFGTRKWLRKILQLTRQKVVMGWNEQEWREVTALAIYLGNWISGIWIGWSTKGGILCT